MEEVLFVSDERARFVVRVIQEFVLRAAQKTHATWTTTVNSGLLRSIENTDHAA
jgi:hypothetical protein